ncbi:MAG TPA: zinc-dependent metalloprotease, partial [Pirellulaceae bacterium]
EVILMWQSRILDQLLSPLTLSRLIDAELHVSQNEDALTAAELLEQLTDTIFSEVTELEKSEFSNRNPAISTFRRNLQRTYMKRLASMALGQTGAPEDCQTVGYLRLQTLRDDIRSFLDKGWKLDDYSRAHLQETQHRIEKVLESRMMQWSP